MQNVSLRIRLTLGLDIAVPTEADLSKLYNVVFGESGAALVDVLPAGNSMVEITDSEDAKRLLRDLSEMEEFKETFERAESAIRGLAESTSDIDIREDVAGTVPLTIKILNGDGGDYILSRRGYLRIN